MKMKLLKIVPHVLMKIQIGSITRKERNEWSEEIENDIDILQKCSRGKWVQCRICESVSINTKHDYGTTRWKEHKRTKKHQKNAGKGTQSICKFFNILDNTNVEANEESKWNVPTRAKICPGIFDDDKHPGLLKLMTMYGEFGDLGVSITTNNNTTMAFVAGCTGMAVLKRPNVSTLATSCEVCYNDSKNQKGNGYKFIRRVKEISKIGAALEALEIPELKDHHIEILRSIAKIRRRNQTDEFQGLKERAKARLMFFDWKKSERN